MSDLADLNCLSCGAQLERVRYFPRQLLTADDMIVEQEYARQKLRRHNRYLHGWGVVCGCSIEAAPTQELPWQVRVCPGYLVVPQGDEVLIDNCPMFDLKKGLQPPDPCTVKWPCPPAGDMPSTERRNLVYLAVRYAECFMRPVRVHPAGCACDETQCEYSRVRDSFELKLLWELPKSHIQARQADDDWCATVKKAGVGPHQHGWPVPPCPSCSDDPWVVLATIKLPESETTNLLQADISYSARRVLLSNTALQVAIACGI
jgi:hypothetical protein